MLGARSCQSSGRVVESDMKIIRHSVICVLVCFAFIAAAEARSFAAFWVQFKTAVAKDDKEAIAEMTRLPFVYGTSKPLSKADFIKECGKLFDQKTRKCFSKAKPIKEDNRDSYSVFCGEEIFVFAKVNGEYRFTDLGMND
jgi:hypothetical protein